jgi:hypothetical protein
MERFGQYETLAPLQKAGRVSLWTARMARDFDGSASHCVKRVQLSDRELSDRDASAAEDLLVAAAIQQSMGYRSVAWAPVYHLGTNGTDAFYVTDRFARSAQSLIDARVRVTASELRTVLMAVVDGLIELQGHYGRPHANLKPSNVMVGQRIRPGTICLTDPAATGDPVPSLVRAPDPKAVGQLLFALVTHRPYTSARWPLPHEPEWDELGASGPEWFALCESLVHPLNGLDMDLDGLMTRIVAIRPSRRRLRRAARLLPVAAAVALACYPLHGRVRGWWGAVARSVQSQTATSPRRPHAVDPAAVAPAAHRSKFPDPYYRPTGNGVAALADREQN